MMPEERPRHNIVDFAKNNKARNRVDEWGESRKKVEEFAHNNKASKKVESWRRKFI